MTWMLRVLRIEVPTTKYVSLHELTQLFGRVEAWRHRGLSLTDAKYRVLYGG